MRFNITDYSRRLIKQPPQRRQQKQQELDVVNSSSKADITQYYYDVAKTPEISDYLEKRFIPMFQWYKSKTKLNMRQFFIWRVSSIILTLFIIIFDVIALGYANRSASSAVAGIGIASSIAAALILGFTTLLQLTKAHENWLLYSRTFERLEREYHLFMLKASPYSINISA
jgi:hypothetical protein